MALNTTTLETNLNTKMAATTGTTESKEFLLLGKAVEALTPTVTVNSVIAEGATQIAAVQAAGSGYASLTGATFTGDIDLGTNKIKFSNVYSTAGDLPSAASYHGMFAHIHQTGKAVFAHGGNWIELVNLDTSGNLTVAGNLTVSGTTTTVNSTTLDVADLNITIADGAADAAAANGAGITVAGASATMLYTSATDTWDFNKAITGTYTNLQPVVDASNVTGSTTIDMRKPMHHMDMTGATSFTGVSIAAGRTAMMVLDTTATPHTPSWGSDIKWPGDEEPTWADSRYWIVSMTCLDGSIILASASGYTV